MIDATRHHWLVRQGKARKRPRPALGIVWHNIGAGAFANAADATSPGSDKRGMDTADWVLWRWETGRMGSAGPNYLITQHGEIVEVCPPEMIANHASSISKTQYTARWARDPDARSQTTWWRERWPMHEHPRQAWPELWTGSAALNTHTIGVELALKRRDIIPDAMAKACRMLADHFAADVPSMRLLTHSDIDPIRRPNFDLDFGQFWAMRALGLING